MIAPIQFIVTRKAMRPASDKEECFYCQQAVGLTHKSDCVLIERKVKVRLKIEYEISVPASWDAEQIEFSRNDGSWCAANAVDELSDLVESGDCLCDRSKYEYIEDAGEAFLNESGD